MLRWLLDSENCIYVLKSPRPRRGGERKACADVNGAPSTDGL